MEAIVQGTGKRGLLRNEKGLTLIELLAVIVILAVIAAIAIPSIGGIINKTKKESHRTNAHMIIDAARYKVSVEDFKPDTGSTTTQTVSLATLNADGFLEKIPKDPQTNSTYSAGATTGSQTTGTYVQITREATTGKTTFAIRLMSGATSRFVDGNFTDSTGVSVTVAGGIAPESVVDTATLQ